MTFSSDVVAKVAIRLFGLMEAERVLQALDQCSAAVPAAERDRVRLAVLKLCDEDPGRSLDKWSTAARTDYRDVLLWAECPGEASAGARVRPSPAELKRLRAADHQQYEAWLKGVA
jgi:hypothetical protein